MIIVLATIELHPGKRPDFLAEFHQIVPKVRAEAGCHEYFPAIDTASGLPVQGPAREDIVVVVEKWDSAALEAHLIAPHMMEYRPKVKSFVKKVSLQILSPAEQQLMRDVLRQLIAAIGAGRPVTWCRLVETRGSTPQKAGAAMLVYDDGSQAGTLGGGCVEAEVKRRALGLLAENRAEVCTFQLDSDYGWDDGLICGGRMKILVEPLAARSPSPYFRQLSELVERGEGCTEALVFDAGASGIPAPMSLLFDHESRFLAGIRHGDTIPVQVKNSLRSLADRPRAYAAQGIAYLPVLPRCRLVIVGGGHVGKAVAALAADLEFDVWIVDDRAEFTSEERFPTAKRRLSGPIDRVLLDLEITSSTYCLIVTRGHSHDQEALFHLADRGARYVGLIGSQRKIKMIFENLAAEGVSPEALAKVYAPLGIDIGSQTVPEIAVSICAELIAHRNLGQVPGRPKSNNI